jgi:protein tyrosine phosphatase
MNKSICLILISCVLASNAALSVDDSYMTNKENTESENRGGQHQNKKRKLLNNNDAPFPATDYVWKTFTEEPSQKDNTEPEQPSPKIESTNNSLLAFFAPAIPQKIWPSTKEWLNNFPEPSWSSIFERLKKEYFTSFISGQPDKIKIGNNDANKPRNRYPHVIAMDSNYVPVPPNKRGEGYFNGSLIDPNEVLKTDFKFSHKYIAGSAPIMKGYWQANNKRTPTVIDFWKVIWGEGISVIVNLTAIKETDSQGYVQIKSDEYWPSGGDFETQKKFEFDDITVEYQESIEVGHISVIALLVKKGSETRIVHLIHYTKWPDEAIGNAPYLKTDLIKMIDIMEQTAKLGQAAGLNGPIFIHCSAGIRRTGAYMIAAMAKEFIDGTGQKPDLPTMIENIQAFRLGSVGYISYCNLIIEALKGYLEEGIKNLKE